jgi:hypothetical protein
MARKITHPPITEPIIVSTLYSTGASVDRVPHAIQIGFWVHTPEIGLDDGEFDGQFTADTGERRIIARIALPLDIARLVAKSIVRALREVGN